MNNRRKSSKNQQATGNIRIIAGKYRGRKLPVVLADGLRPNHRPCQGNLIQLVDALHSRRSMS